MPPPHQAKPCSQQTTTNDAFNPVAMPSLESLKFPMGSFAKLPEVVLSGFVGVTSLHFGHGSFKGAKTLELLSMVKVETIEFMEDSFASTTELIIDGELRVNERKRVSESVLRSDGGAHRMTTCPRVCSASGVASSYR